MKIILPKEQEVRIGESENTMKITGTMTPDVFVAGLNLMNETLIPCDLNFTSFYNLYSAYKTNKEVMMAMAGMICAYGSLLSRIEAETNKGLN